MIKRIFYFLTALLISTSFLVPSSFAAQTATSAAKPEPTKSTTSPAIPARKPNPVIIPDAPDLNVKSYVLMDASNGNILASKNSHERLEPASLTKLMTLYVAFNALASGQIHLNDKVRISKKAWQTGGSRMFLQAGTAVTVKDLIRGIVVASGNDATVALAEHIGGTSQAFVDIMNKEAEQLGMKDSHFQNPDGLPAPQHYSSAYDLAILTNAIINHFPQYYPYFKEKYLNWNNIKQPNRNKLLWSDASVDGLKTGYTAAAGYCLVTSAKRKGMRLISVVMGAPSTSSRARDSQALLNYGFRFYETHNLFSAYETIKKVRVWFGKHKYLALGLLNNLSVTLPAGEAKDLKAEIILDQTKFEAPIKKGQKVGTVNVTLNGDRIVSTPLVTLTDDRKGGLYTWARDHISLLIKKII